MLRIHPVAIWLCLILILAGAFSGVSGYGCALAGEPAEEQPVRPSEPIEEHAEAHLDPEPAHEAVADAVLENIPEQAPILEDAVAPGADEKAPEDEKPIVVETPEQQAARIEAEHKVKVEKERQELLHNAEEFIKTADETIIQALPYPFDILFGQTFFDITLWRYLAGAGLLCLGALVYFRVTRRFKSAMKSLETREPGTRWHQFFDVVFLSIRNPAKMFIISLLLRSVSSLLVTVYHPDIIWFANLLGFLGIVLFFFDMVGYVDKVYGDRIFHSSDRLMETVRPIVMKLLRFCIIFVAGMQIYQGVTGQPMVSLLAGLGIGGLALALASQETLQNLLGFVSIAMDKAFLLGDGVNIAGYDGTVERVGIRSVKLRAYDGNSVVIPNSVAINSSILNRNRRPYIRREIRIALSPLNSFAKVEQAMELIREAVEQHEGKVAGLPPVVRFIDYEPARFIIQVFFWYDSEKPFFFDECSRVNLGILKNLSEAGVIFAER